MSWISEWVKFEDQIRIKGACHLLYKDFKAPDFIIKKIKIKSKLKMKVFTIACVMAAAMTGAEAQLFSNWGSRRGWGNTMSTCEFNKGRGSDDQTATLDVKLKQKNVSEGEDLGDTTVVAEGSNLTASTEYSVALIDDDADACAGTELLDLGSFTTDADGGGEVEGQFDIDIQGDASANG